MDDSVQVPLGRAEYEIEVLRSRFIGCTQRVNSAEEAREFIAQVKKEYPAASHYVPAFQIGGGASVISHCSDDGEPSGTAGRPVLVVVQGSGLHNICVVVVRYFGGTKLGTGGLVRAYTECAQGALRATQRGREIEVVSIGIVMEYADYDRFQYLLRDFWTDEMDRNFGEKVDVLFTIGFHEFERLQRSLDELSNGRLEAIILERKRKVIPIDTGNS